MKNRINNADRVFLSAIWTVILVLLTGVTARAATLVQEFYLPMPEQQIYQANSAIISGTGQTNFSTFSIVVTGDGTQIFYDQWEDGYEVNLASPAQATTQVWGDGNNANGIPPGMTNDPSGLPAGTVITLTNNVPLPRNPSVVLWDARDRVAATKALVISRAAWPIPTGPVFAGAVGVLSTLDYGTNYISPVGQDMTNINLMKYVGMFVMAAQNNTAVTIDPNGNGVGTTSIVLNQGESYLINGGIKKGGRISSSKPVQADLLIGHVGASYASDWFTLYPVESWDNTYYTPVSSASSGTQPAYVYLFNPSSNAITINYSTRAGSGNFSIPGTNGVYQFQMPIGSGASFTSASGQNFFAICTVAANNSSDTAYNWGFTLVPKAALTTEGTVGWGPGSADGTVNGSPVWVTTLGSTIVYVDYKGDKSGPLTDPDGGKYDTNFAVVNFQSLKIYDPSKNQTGMRVYTTDGTLLTAAWGEDAEKASPGNPYIDAGTTVLPFPVPVLRKTASVTNDVAPIGLSVGDTIQYSVQVDNKGLLPLGNTIVIDAPSTNLTYVTNSTSWNGQSIPDSVSGTPFPLDAPGFTIPLILSRGTSTFQYQFKVNAAGVLSNSVNIGGTPISTFASLNPPPTNGVAVNVRFTDISGNTVALYSAGGNVFVTLTNAVGNTSSNSIQTLSVTVIDTNTADAETISLTETGNNTGVFRNTTGLPTSLTAGIVSQNGTLKVGYGDTLTVSYTEPTYGSSSSATAGIQVPVPNKQLYLSVNGSTNGTQALNRINPVAAAFGTTRNSVDIGSGSAGGGGTGSVTIISTNTVSGSGNNNSITNVTVSGSNTLLLVTVALNPGNSGGGVSGINYNGQALSLITTRRDGNNTGNKSRVEIWQLLNPPAGTASVTITCTGNPTDVMAGALVMNGVDQSVPFTATNAVDGNSSLPSITISSATNAIVINVLSINAAGNTGTTTGSGQARLWGLVRGSQFGGTSRSPGTNSVTASWSVTAGAEWASAALSVKAAAAVAPVAGPATNSTVFAQTPAFALPFTMPAGGSVSITNFITLTNGSFSANPNVTATLRTNGVNFLTLTNPVFTAAGSVTNLVWTGTLPSTVTVPAGAVISYLISNNVSGTAFRVKYDSTNAASQIVLPATTVITMDTLGVYDAPYPGGSIVTTPVAGSTLYVRAVASDPFGAYDITSLGLNFTGPSSGYNFTVSSVTNVVATNAASKTFEYVWNTGVAVGGWNIAATANEGTEGVSAVASTGVETIVLDLGTPSTTEFTSGNNGGATNSYLANSTVCVRVTDLNRNTNASTVQTVIATVSSSAGDSEIVTLTETGTNTGIFTFCLATSTNAAVIPNNGTLTAPVGSVLTASYTDDTDPADTTSATATIQPLPGVPGVLMNKTIVSPSGGQVGVGQPVVYNLQVVNVGSTTLPSLKITDTFSSSKLNFVSASVSPDTTTANTLTWNNLGAFSPGQSTNITVTFTTLATGTATNSATANGSTATNSSSVTLAVNAAAVNVVKTLLSPTNQPVSIQSNVVFRITVQNVGNTAINFLPMEDDFSGAYYEYVSATIPPSGTGFGTLIWTNLASSVLATNAIITNDITMKVVGQGSPANNTATVDFATDVFGNPVPTASSTVGVTTSSAGISGHVYYDPSQLGTYTNGMTGLAGLTMGLYTDPNGDGNPSDGALVQVTTTDGSGYYELLNLTMGKYVVVENHLPGYASSSPYGNQLPVNLTSLTTSTNNNFFDYQPSVSLLSTFSGYVLEDTNAVAAYVAGMPGIAYVSLNLVQDVNSNGIADLGEPVMGNATTDTNGSFSLAGITPGAYVITETDPFGFYSTGDSQGTNNNQIAIVTTNGVTVTNNFFFDRRSPVANDDTNSTVYFTPVIINALVNDSSPYGEILTITNVSTAFGTAVINPGSTNITFTPTSVGTATISYTIVDQHGGTASATITVEVSPKPLTITALSTSKTYGQTVTFAGTEFTVVGLTNGNSVTSVTLTSAGAVNTAIVGSYAIIPSAAVGSGLANYAITYSTNGTLTVNPALLGITANNTNRLYNTANPTFTYTPTGFVNGDTASVLSGAPSLTTLANLSSPVGTYSIAATNGTLSATNYIFAFTNGTLTVIGGSYGITWTNPASIVYGTPLGTNQNNASATVGGSYVYNPTNGVILPVGTNTLSVVFTPTDTNYASTNVSVQLVVTPAPLTITANNQSKFYGTALSLGTSAFSSSGLVNGETVGSVTLSSVGTPTNAAAGTYAIVPSAATGGTFNPSNYSITYSNGVLTVNAATLTVTANSTNKIYGAANPAFTASYSGFVNGDTSSVLSGSPSLTTSATTNSAVGPYTITATNGTLTAANYVFTFVNGTLTVNAATLTVTANSTNKVYGAVNPTFTASYAGFANGETASVLSGSPSLSSSATTNSGVGGYPIVATNGTLSAANYVFSFMNGTLTVNAATLTVTANNTNRLYNTANPTFTASYSGFVNGETSSVLSGAPSLTTTAILSSPAGTYPISATNGTLTAANYVFSFVNGTLTIVNGAYGITWTNPASIVYGTLLGTNQNNASATVGGSYVYNPTNGTLLPAGTNLLTVVFTPTDTNYPATNASVQLVVTPAPLTITANSTNKPYNTTLNLGTTAFTSSGLVNSETVGGVTIASAGTVISAPVGAYPITPSNATGGTFNPANYSITYSNGTLTVSAVAYTATWATPTNIVYGTPLGTNQNNATASIGGTFTYNPTNGVVLPVGTNTLTVLFTPTDTNYAATNLSVPLIVTPAPLTIVASSTNKVYGTALNLGTSAFTSSGLVNGETVGGVTLTSLGTPTNAAAGTYAIVPSAATGGTFNPSNYSITYSNGVLTVNAATLTVTANSTNKVYGAANPTFTASYSGFVNGDTAGVLSGSPSLTTSATTNSAVGPYTITATNGTLTAANYVFTFVNGTLTVNAATLTVTANDTNRLYNTANPTFTASYSGFVNGETTAILSGTPSLTTTATISSPGGTYPITAAAGSLTAPNYTFSFVNGTLTVIGGNYGITWTNPVSIVYGTPLGTNQNNASATVGGSYVYNPTNGTVLPAGTNILSVVFTPSDTNYASTNVTVQLVVTPAPLTITANSTNKAYNTTLNLGTTAFTSSGLVNGDSVSNVTLTSAGTIASAPVGTYPITPSNAIGSGLTNYSIAYSNGVLTVLNGSYGITWTNPASIVYGTPLGTNQNNASATVGGSYVYNPTNGVILPVGTNTLSVVFTPTDTNYASTNVSVQLVVTPAPLTITANNQSKFYGTALSLGTSAFSSSGLVNGETVGSVTLSSVGTPTNAAAGTYAIVPSAATGGTFNPSNYSITYSNGVLTVNAATLTVTANSTNKIYGAANPAFTASYSGFVNGDTSSVLSGSPSLTTSATTNSAVGPYTITATNGTLTAANYVFTFVNGTLTVNAATLTVTANSTNKVYGAVNPTFTASYAGFANGETASVLSGSPSLSSSATTNSGVGGYPIVATNGTLSAANYVFSFMNGTLTVNAATLTVTANSTNKVYGAANPTFTPSYSGFVNGDTAGVLSGSPSLTTTATTNSAVGPYTITATNGTLTAANYVFTFVNGTLTIGQASLSVTANDQVKNYGSTLTLGAGQIAFTSSGLKNGETIGSVTLTASGGTAALDAPGTYTITPSAATGGTFSLANYNVSYFNGSLIVTQTVTADLSVFKTGPASAVAGSNIVYTITVTNLGPGAATNVVIKDWLPAGFTFVSAVPANYAFQPNSAAPSNSVTSYGSVTWLVSKLAANGRTNLTITLRSADGGTFTNIATATSDAYDPNSGNSDGSSTNSQARTVVSPLADVAVVKIGGTNAYAGGAADYTILVTNLGPSTASNVVVMDRMPTNTTFLTASGSYTISSNVVTWDALTLTNGEVASFTISLKAPVSGSFTNIALSTSSTGDPVATNNNGTAGSSRVATKTVPSADVIVFLVGPPAAVQGSNFLYTLTITNAGPSTSSNVVVSDSLPLGLTFVAASGNGKNTNGVITWPAIKSLPVGGVTNFTLTVFAPGTGTFTNIASAVAVTHDPDSTNNSGVLPNAKVATQVGVAQFSILAGLPALNPQTGLFEETVAVTNTGNVTVLGFRLYVGNLPSGVTLYNAAGISNGLPFVNYNFPVDPSNAVSLILQFYNSTRLPFTNTLYAEAILPAGTATSSTNGSVAVSRVFADTRIDGDMRFVVEFPTVPGKTYTIIYSSDLLTWKVATPSVKAANNVTQWYDDGPPVTESKPSSVTARYYRVIQY